MKNFKKILSVFLTVVMMLSVVSIAVGTNGAFGIKASAANMQEEINAENKLHENNVKNIESKYDSKIESCQNSAQSIMREYGVSSLSSSSYYNSQLDSLESQAADLQKKIDYYSRGTTPNDKAMVRNYQTQLENINEKIYMYSALNLAVSYLNEADRLEGEKANELSKEDTRHKQALENIRNGQGDTSDSEVTDYDFDIDYSSDIISFVCDAYFTFTCFMVKVIAAVVVVAIEWIATAV